MATATPFFQYAYGVDSPSTVPPALSLSATGTLSYRYGYTENYEQNLLTTSTALPIPRSLTNGLFYDITYAIQQIQTNGASLWVDPASGGPLLDYPIYAQVQHSYSMGPAYIWESNVASNAVEPGVDATWRVVSGAGIVANSNVPAGSAIPLALATTINLTSLALPAGKWALYGNVVASFTTMTNPQIQVGISTNTAAFPDGSKISRFEDFTASATTVQGGPAPMQVITLAVPSTVYLVTRAEGSGGTLTVCGDFTAISVSAATV